MQDLKKDLVIGQNNFSLIFTKKLLEKFKKLNEPNINLMEPIGSIKFIIMMNLLRQIGFPETAAMTIAEKETNNSKKTEGFTESMIVAIEQFIKIFEEDVTKKSAEFQLGDSDYDG